MTEDVHRAGFVALLGPPNVGKSSLLNRMLGERLAIVSRKPQTTRSRLLGILTRPNAQHLFLDTPGLHDSKKKLNAALNEIVHEVKADCDLALVLVDRTRGWTEVHDELVAGLRARQRPYLVVGTKSDLPSAEDAAWPPPEAEGAIGYHAVSSETGAGIDALLEAIDRSLPEDPPLYPEDALTDRPLRFLCAELVREAAFEELSQEIPYAMAVEVVKFDETRPDLTVIHADVLVGRDSHKRIVIGQGGRTIKALGTRARASIEKLLAKRVHLQLFVKVDPGWAKNARRIEELGYH